MEAVPRVYKMVNKTPRVCLDSTIPVLSIEFQSKFTPDSGHIGEKPKKEA